MAQIHALTPEGRLPSAAVQHAEEIAGQVLGSIPARVTALEYTSGRRNITSLINADDWATGTTQAYLIRSGTTVNLSFRNVRRTDGASGTLLLLTLPVGFRPTGYQYVGTFRGAGFIADANGTVQVNNPTSPSDHMSLTWITTDATPSTLPGTPA